MKTIATFRHPALPSVPEAMRILGRLEIEVEHAETYVELLAILSAAEAWQKVFRPVAEISNKAGILGAKAEHRLGSELAKAPKASGIRMAGRDSVGGTKTEPPNDTPTLAEMNVTKKRSTRAQKLAQIKIEELAAIAAQLIEEGKAVTSNAILGAVRQQTKRDKVHAVSVAVFSADGPFGTVVIDPPWKMEKIDRDVLPCRTTMLIVVPRNNTTRRACAPLAHMCLESILLYVRDAMAKSVVLGRETHRLAALVRRLSTPRPYGRGGMRVCSGRKSEGANRGFSTPRSRGGMKNDAKIRRCNHDSVFCVRWLRRTW